MKAIEVTIKYGDRTVGDSGAVSWVDVEELLTALVNGTDRKSMTEEASRMVTALLRQIAQKQ